MLCQKSKSVEIIFVFLLTMSNKCDKTLRLQKLPLVPIQTFMLRKRQIKQARQGGCKKINKCLILLPELCKCFRLHVQLFGIQTCQLPTLFFLMSSFAFIPIRKCMHASTIRFHLELAAQNISLNPRLLGICYFHFGNRVHNGQSFINTVPSRFKKDFWSGQKVS